MEADMSWQDVKICIATACEPSNLGKLHEDLVALLKKASEAGIITSASLDISYGRTDKFRASSTDDT